MNKLLIDDTSCFVNTFLSSITKVTEDCILDITDDKFTCLSATSDGTLVQLVEMHNDNKFVQTCNIPDIKRLHKILGCVPQELPTELKVTQNSISYSSSATRFKFYLLEDGILSTPAVSVEKIKKLEYDIEFTVPYDKLTELVKGSTFSNETEKMYIYTDENNSVYGELTDREKPNVDSFAVQLHQGIDNSISPLPFNFENIRILSSSRCNEYKFSINSQLGVVKVDISRNKCYISYIISTLLK